MVYICVFKPNFSVFCFIVLRLTFGTWVTTARSVTHKAEWDVAPRKATWPAGAPGTRLILPVLLKLRHQHHTLRCYVLISARLRFLWMASLLHICFFSSPRKRCLKSAAVVAGPGYWFIARLSRFLPASWWHRCFSLEISAYRLHCPNLTLRPVPSGLLCAAECVEIEGGWSVQVSSIPHLC